VVPIARYRCGAKAANELDRFIAGRLVSCVDIDERTYDRVVAVCTVGSVDLADWMVRQGLAFDWPKYSKGDYAVAQNEARQAERGLWRGACVMRWDYIESRNNRAYPEQRVLSPRLS
jgi:endonuclease YncB( thermonuclease family)